MPTYEYRCNDCGRKVTLFYKTYDDYDSAMHTCPHCGSANLTRLISRVGISVSPISRLMSGDVDDDSAFDDLENADPRTLGHMLREMSAETGEDLGPEFEEVVGRLEKGESPEDIEASLPPEPSDMGGGADTSFAPDDL